MPHTWICDIAFPQSYKLIPDFVTAHTLTEFGIQLKWVYDLLALWYRAEVSGIPIFRRNTWTWRWRQYIPPETFYLFVGCF